MKASRKPFDNSLKISLLERKKSVYKPIKTTIQLLFGAGLKKAEIFKEYITNNKRRRR